VYEADGVRRLVAGSTGTPSTALAPCSTARATAASSNAAVTPAPRCSGTTKKHDTTQTPSRSSTGRVSRPCWSRG